MSADLIAEFCGFYEPYHGITDERGTRRVRVLRDFESHIAPMPVVDAGADELSDYLAILVGRGLAPTTVRQYLGLVSPFFRWLWERQHIDADRLMRIRDVRPPRGAVAQHEPRPYSRTELKRFWLDLDASYPWSPGPKPSHGRGRMFVNRWERGWSEWARVEAFAMRLQVECMVALALYGGLRRDEAFYLDLLEMDYDNDYIVVHSARKNPQAESRERAVPITAKMHGPLKAWLEFRESIAPAHDRPWLSLHTRDHYLKPMQHTRFATLLARVGSHGYDYHRLRHTYATNALRAGMPLETLRVILGHSTIGQTLAYAAILKSDVVSTARRVDREFEDGREVA